MSDLASPSTPEQPAEICGDELIPDNTAEAVIRDFIETYEVQAAGVWAQSPDEAAPELIEQLRQNGFEITRKA